MTRACSAIAAQSMPETLGVQPASRSGAARRAALNSRCETRISIPIVRAGRQGFADAAGLGKGLGGRRAGRMEGAATGLSKILAGLPAEAPQGRNDQVAVSPDTAKRCGALFT